MKRRNVRSIHIWVILFVAVAALFAPALTSHAVEYVPSLRCPLTSLLP